MRFIAACCVYDDPTWIVPMAHSVGPAVEQILFLVNRHPWNSEGGDNAQTMQRIAEASKGVSVQVIEGSWANETDQRNAGLEFVRQLGGDYCMVVDADELYDPQALERVKQAIAQHPEIGAWYISMYTYWKSFRFRIDPPEQFKPVVFAKVGVARFSENRHVQSPNWGEIPPALAVCHHMSYARSDEEVLKKLARFSHSHEILPGWYERVWKGWDNNQAMENLHPVHPQIYRRAVLQREDAYPPVLRALAQKS